MRVWISLVMLGCGLGGVELIAQEKPAAKTTPKVPVYALKISGEEPVAALLPNQVYDPAFGCPRDGSIGVNVNLPPVEAKPQSAFVFYVISPSGKTVSFDFKKIDDLALSNGQRAMAYEVGERDVDFLFNTVPVKSGPGIPPEGKAPPGWFVARFDRDGAYHGATELNLPRLVPQRMAAFDDGDLLIFALDEANRQPQLVQYSMIGQKLHYYFADAEFARKNPAGPTLVAKGTNPDRGRLELAQLRQSMQMSQLGHWKDAIVLLQTSEGAPLFLAYPDGSVRTVKLPKVEGFQAEKLIASDNELYVAYWRPGADSSGPDEILILELDGNTGEELRRIAPGELEVACVHRGKFRVIRHEGQHTFKFFSATVGAAVESSVRVPASK